MRKEKTYLAGSKALDALAKLIQATEGFFHPSNYGAWAPHLVSSRAEEERGAELTHLDAGNRADSCRMSRGSIISDRRCVSILRVESEEGDKV